MDRDEDLIARHIGHYSELFEQQTARGWPASFRFPEPQDATEREALRLFIAEIEAATGKRVRYTSQPGSA